MVIRSLIFVRLPAAYTYQKLLQSDHTKQRKDVDVYIVEPPCIFTGVQLILVVHICAVDTVHCWVERADNFEIFIELVKVAV